MNPFMTPLHEYQRVMLGATIANLLDEGADPDRIEDARIRYGATIEETIDILDELETH